MTRHIPLEGASNFRDFGGYPTDDGRQVKWRTLYRSDRLSGLTPADYETLAEHGIRLVCDLRRHLELDRAPTRWLGEPTPELWHAPLFDDSVKPSILQVMSLDGDARKDPARVRELMIDIYRRMVTAPETLQRLREIFARLAAAENYPVLIHCSGGKDRTGVTCALLLSLLGVSRDDVMADYLLTQQYYQGLADLRLGGTQVIDKGMFDGWAPEALVPIYSVEEAYLDTALEIVDRDFGTVSAFLEQKVGVAPEQLLALRRHLLAET